MNTAFTEWLFPWKAKRAISKLRDSVCILEHDRNLLEKDLRLSRDEIELCKQAMERTASALESSKNHSADQAQKLRTHIEHLEGQQKALSENLTNTTIKVSQMVPTVELQAAQAKAESAARAVKALTAWIKADRKLDKASTEQVVMEILRTQTK